MRILSSLARSMRIEHSIILDLAVITIIKLYNVHFTTPQLLFALISPFLISAGAFLLNDFFDIHSDRINNKKTPLVLGEISPRLAYEMSILIMAIGVGMAAPLGIDAMLIALIFASLSYLYNWKLKDLPLIGNIIIASSMSIVFIFTGVSFGTLNNEIIILSLSAFIFGLGREIIKSAEDIKGDIKARNSRTLPVIIGKKWAVYVAIILIIGAASLNIYLYEAYEKFVKGEILGRTIMFLTNGIIVPAIIYEAIKLDKKSLINAKKISLLAMAMVILALLLT